MQMWNKWVYQTARKAHCNTYCSSALEMITSVKPHPSVYIIPLTHHRLSGQYSSNTLCQHLFLDWSPSTGGSVASCPILSLAWDSPYLSHVNDCGSSPPSHLNHCSICAPHMQWISHMEWTSPFHHAFSRPLLCFLPPTPALHPTSAGCQLSASISARSSVKLRPHLCPHIIHMTAP